MPSPYIGYQIGTGIIPTTIQSATDSWKIILSNTAPNVATHTTAASATELGTAGGYTAGGDDAPRTVKNLKYKPKPRKDDFGNEIVVPEAISALTVERYTLKPTQVNANELQSHLEIDDEEAILMFI